MNFLWQFFGYDHRLSYAIAQDADRPPEMLPKQPNLLRRNSKRFVIGDESEEDLKERNERTSEKEEWNRTARFLTVGTTLT